MTKGEGIYPAPTHKRVEELDAELEKLQKSTRTSFPIMVGIHDVLRQRFRWYYNWHMNSWSSVVHWAILSGYTVASFVLLFSLVVKGPAHPIYAASKQAWANPEDWKSWTLDNLQITADGVQLAQRSVAGMSTKIAINTEPSSSAAPSPDAVVSPSPVASIGATPSTSPSPSATDINNSPSLSVSASPSLSESPSTSARPKVSISASPEKSNAPPSAVVTNYVPSGTATITFDPQKGQIVDWLNSAVAENLNGQSIKIEFSTDGILWTEDAKSLANSEKIYLKLIFTSTDQNVSPVLNSLTLNYSRLPKVPDSLKVAVHSGILGSTQDFSAGAFNDPDNDDHAASQWQVTNQPGIYATPLVDSGTDTKNLTSFTSAKGLANGNYYFRVRFEDSTGAWSPWSEEFAFTINSAKQVENIGDNQIPANPNEIISARTETTKTIDNKNGTMTLISDPGLMHFKESYSDKNAQWQDINPNHFVDFPDFVLYDQMPSTVKVFKDKVGYEIQSRKTGEKYTVELQSVAGGAPVLSQAHGANGLISWADINGANSIRSTSSGQAFKIQNSKLGGFISPALADAPTIDNGNLKFEFQISENGVRLWKTITGPDAPTGFQWKITKTGSGNDLKFRDKPDAYDITNSSTDAINTAKPVTIDAKKISGDMNSTFTWQETAPKSDMKIDTDVYYSYPSCDQSTHACGTNVVDGTVYRDGTQGSWTFVRTGGGTSASTTFASGIVAAFSTGVSQVRGIYRSPFLFDTSAISSGATISAASLTLYGSAKSDGAVAKTPDISIYTSAPTSTTTLAITDFDIARWGSSPLTNTITYAGWQTDGTTPNVFTFTSPDTQIIKAGISEFGARNVNYDGANNDPTVGGISGGTTYGLSGYFADQAGTLQDPVLSVTYTVASPPTAPSGVNFNTQTTTGFTVGWTDNSSDETGFKVYTTNTGTTNCTTATYSGTPDYTTAADAVTQAITGKSVNTQYCAAVKATNAVGDSAAAYSSAAYTLANVPGTPTVDTPTTTSLKVKIAQNSNPAGTTFAIYNQTTSQYVQANGTLGASAVWQDYATWGGASGIINTGLSVATSYTYQVKARNGDLTQTALSTGGTASTSANPPTAPSGVSINTETTTGFTVGWTDNSSDETGFKVYTAAGNADCSAASYSGTPDFTTAANAVTQAITGKSVNTQYCAKVVATNADGDSTASYAAAKYTLANVPGAPTFGTVTSSVIPVTVNVNSNPSSTTFAIKVVDGGTNYVQANGTSGASPVWQTASVWSSPKNNTGLTPNTLYTYSVAATNGDMTATAYSTTAAATTLTTHTITASDGANGAISPTGVITVDDGASQAFTFGGNSGYHISTLTIDGTTQTTLTSPYTFTNVTGDHTISITAVANNTCVWTGLGTNNNWSTTLNWSGNAVPTASCDVIFDSTSTKASTIDAGFTNYINSFSLNSGYTNTLTMGADLNIDGDATLAAGTIDGSASHYTFYVAGSWTNTNTTFAANKPSVDFNGAIPSKTITTHGQSFYNMTVDGGTSYGSNQNTLRPNSDIETAMLPTNCTNRYDCVSDQSDTTFVTAIMNSGIMTATYGTLANSVPSNATNISVTDYIRVKTNDVANNVAYPELRVNGADYDYSAPNVSSVFTDFSTTWTTNPSTSAPWTVADLASTFPGVKVDVQGAVGLQVSEVWMVISYSTPLYGGWTLQDNLTVENATTISSDTLTSGANTVTTKDYSQSGGIFNAPSTNMNVSGNFIRNGGTFNNDSGTVNLTGADSSTQQISGSLTFNNLSASTSSNSAGRTLQFGVGSTTTVTGTWTVTGYSGKVITLAPSSVIWYINPSAWAVDYVSVSHSTNLAGAEINPTNSTDGGNNVNWFPAAPTAPSGVSINTETTTGFTVGWTDNSSDETGFKVYTTDTGTSDCTTATYSGTPDYTTAADVVTQAITGKSVNTQYCAAVKATNAVGDSSVSYSTAAYTLANVPGTPTVDTPTTTSLKVKIDQNSDPAGTTYAIYNQTATQYVQANGTLGASAVWQDYATWGGASGIVNTGLTSNTSYTYQVKARNGDLTQTALSTGGTASTSANPPTAPSGATIGTITTTGFTVTWSDNSSNETGFKVYTAAGTADCSTASYSGTPDTTTAANATSQAITGKSVNTQYCAKVVATNADGDSTASYAAAKYTLANVPGAPTLGTPGSTSIPVTINQNSNPANTTYTIKVVYGATTRYLKTDGTLQSTKVYATYTTWGGASGITNTGLSANTQYTYSVAGQNGDGPATAFSTTVAATTLTTHTITPLAGSHTTITPSSALLVDNGGSETFTMAADSGYTISDVLVDGVSAGAVSTYTFTNVTTDHTISVSAVANLPTAPSGANINTETTTGFTVGWTDNSSNETGFKVYTTAGQADCSTATYSGTPDYTTAADAVTQAITGKSVNTQYCAAVKATNADGDSAAIYASPAYTLANVPGTPTVNVTSSSSLTIIIDQNSNPAGTTYAIYNQTLSKYVQTNGSSGTSAVWQDYTTWGGASGIANTGLSPNTLYAYQVKARNGDMTETDLSTTTRATTKTTHTITSSNDANGTISPTGVTAIDAGGSQSYTFSANSGYHISTLIIDGTAQSTLTSPYNFTNVTSSHTIAVTTAANNTCVWTGLGADNNWSTTLNWSANAAPTASCDVIFNATSTQDSTINSGFTNHIKSLSLNSGYTNTLTMATDLNIDNDATLTAGTLAASTYTINVAGSWNVTGGTFDKGSGTVNFNGSAIGKTVTSAGQQFNNMTVSGAFPKVSDTFDISINPDYWGEFDSRNPTSVSSGRAHVYVATGGGADGGGLTSHNKWYLHGDFDIQVDYQMVAPQAILQLSDNADIYSVDSGTVYGIYYAGGFGSRGGMSGSDSTALATSKFRMVRSGTSMTGYFWNGGWVQFSSASNVNQGDLYVNVIGGNVYNHAEVYYDNFIVNSGTTVGTAGTTSLTLELQDSLSVANTLSVVAGTLTAGADTVTTHDFTQSGGIFNAPSTDMNVSGNFAYSAGTFNNDSGTVNLTGVDSSTQQISGSLTFNNLSASTSSNSVGRTLQFAAGSTTTVAGTWTVTGYSGKVITLAPSSAATWYINPSAWAVDYVDVSYSTNQAGAEINPTNSAGGDGGNNLNWFTPVPVTHTITASSGANGSISPSSALVDHGSALTFTITPDTGYHIADVMIDTDTDVGAFSTYTFTNVTTDHTIRATFAVNPASQHTITASANAGGAIDPSGDLSVAGFANKDFTITPDAGHFIDYVKVDSVNKGAIGTYTFSSVTADHTIEAFFGAYPTAIANPTNFSGTAGNSQTYLNWVNPQTTYFSYEELFRSTQKDTLGDLISTNLKDITYHDPGLANDTTYYYTLKAVDTIGNISTGTEQLALTPTNQSDTQAPTMPTNSRATDIKTTEIALAWDAPTDNVGVVGYQLFNADTQVMIATTSNTDYAVTGLTPETVYRFYVQAYDAAGNFSDRSNILMVTTLKGDQPTTQVYLMFAGAPSEATAGQSLPGKIKIMAVDGGGAMVVGYTNSVYFTTSDTKARILWDSANRYTFTSDDRGVHEFNGSDFVFNLVGNQILTVTDDHVSGSAAIKVNGTLNVLNKAEDSITSLFANLNNGFTPAASNVSTALVSTITAGLAIPLVFNASLALINIWPQLIYLLTNLFQLFGIRRRRAPWGTVFNSQTGQSIPYVIVKIFDKEYNRLLETAVTDSGGRFGFLVRSNTYYLVAQKSGYKFPSEYKMSGYFDHIYTGGDLTINDKDKTVTVNISMDPQTKLDLSYRVLVAMIRFNRTLGAIRLWLLAIGMLVAMILLIVSYNIFYLLSLIFYIMVAALDLLRLKKARPYGIVTDTYGAALETVIVRIYEKRSGRLVGTEVTDIEGRFKFLVNPGVYYLTTVRPEYVDFKSHIMYLEKEKTMVSVNIRMRKVEK